MSYPGGMFPGWEVPGKPQEYAMLWIGISTPFPGLQHGSQPRGTLLGMVCIHFQ